MAYHHLNREERYQISALLKAGLTPTQISVNLGRHKSTISRKKSRNSGLRGYRPGHVCLAPPPPAARTLDRDNHAALLADDFSRRVDSALAVCNQPLPLEQDAASWHAVRKGGVTA